MNEAYCVCSTSEAYKSYLHNWKDFPTRDNLWAIIDVSRKDCAKDSPEFKNWHTFTESDVRQKLHNFPHNPSNRHFWNTQGNRNIIWFYAHFRMLHFYLAHPDYDYYWFFDDDVTCSDWSQFVDAFRGNDVDFLAYYIFKNEDVTTEPNIPTVNREMHSYSWFNRFPGHGDVIPAKSKLFGSFFAITRFSNKAMKQLYDECSIDCWYGYSEGFVPTMLADAGMKLDTIYGSDSKSKHFNVSEVDIKHKNITINWSWL